MLQVLRNSFFNLHFSWNCSLCLSILELITCHHICYHCHAEQQTTVQLTAPTLPYTQTWPFRVRFIYWGMYDGYKNLFLSFGVQIVRSRLGWNIATAWCYCCAYTKFTNHILLNKPIYDVLIHYTRNYAACIEYKMHKKPYLGLMVYICFSVEECFYNLAISIFTCNIQRCLTILACKVEEGIISKFFPT